MRWISSAVGEGAGGEERFQAATEASDDTAVKRALGNWIEEEVPRPRHNVCMKKTFDQFVLTAARTQYEMRSLHLQNPRGVYVNYIMNLKEIDVFGFDYDYTLANYR